MLYDCTMVFHLLIFAQPVIMFECVQAEGRVRRWIHPGSWHLLDWWPTHVAAVYCANIIYNPSWDLPASTLNLTLG